MRFDNKISEKLSKQIEEFEKTPIAIGEKVYVNRSAISSYSFGNNKTDVCEIIRVVDQNTFIVRETGSLNSKEVSIKKEDIAERANKWDIGAYHFSNKGGRIQTFNFSFDSIIFEFELDEKRKEKDYIIGGVETTRINWNPFVYDKDGVKQYYQRDFCWTIEEKQNLINSIYNKINLGLVLVRKRSWQELEQMAKMGEKELAFIDIVDGKQRLNAIKGFINDEFPDSYGDYFSDLSVKAKREFFNHQTVQYAEMGENTKDEDVIYQFLKLNFTGVPQSKEHIEYVKSLSLKF